MQEARTNHHEGAGSLIIAGSLYENKEEMTYGQRTGIPAGRSVKGNYSTSAGQADGIVGYIALL